MDQRADLYFAVVPEWVLEVVSPRALQVYTLLRRYADNEGLAWPSRRTLARRLRTGVKTIDRAVLELIEAGALETTPRWREEGQGQTSNEYRLRAVPLDIGDQGGGVKYDQGGGSRMSPHEPEKKNQSQKELARAQTSGCGSPATPTGGPCLIQTPCWAHDPTGFRDKMDGPEQDGYYVMMNHGARRDLLWEAVLLVAGVAPVTKSERGRTGRAVKELREAEAKPGEIVARGIEYRRRWPGIDFTAQGLVNNWSRLADVKGGQVEQMLARLRTARERTPE